METSRAETGSSAMISLGFRESARATPMRCRWPPENSCGKRLKCSGLSPTISRSSRTRLSLPPGGLMPLISIGPPTMVPTVCRGFSDEYGSWKIIWISARIGFSSLRLAWPISRPAYLMLPSVGSSSRDASRPAVDLPQPDSPTRPSVSPACTVRSMPSTAWTLPTWCLKMTPPITGKCFFRPDSSSSASPRGSPVVSLTFGSPSSGRGSGSTRRRGRGAGTVRAARSGTARDRPAPCSRTGGGRGSRAGR